MLYLTNLSSLILSSSIAPSLYGSIALFYRQTQKLTAELNPWETRFNWQARLEPLMQ